MKNESTHSDAGGEGESLDALLAQARWPEASEESRRELLEVWDAKWNGRLRWRRIVWAGSAIAAMVAVVIGIGQLAKRRGMNRETPIVQQDPVKREGGKAVVAYAERGVPSRESNELERLLLGPQAMRPKKQAMEEPRVVQAAPPRVTPIESRQTNAAPPVILSAIDRGRVLQIAATLNPAIRRRMLGELVASTNANDLRVFLEVLLEPRCREDALAVLKNSPAPPDVGMLVARFDDARMDCRFAAARALGTLCGEHVRDELEQMVMKNTHRREALAALLCCEDSRASEFLAAARADRAMDAQIRAVQGEIKRLF